jgi:hypothetical protein
VSTVSYPIDDETRAWLNARISWILDQFGLDYICRIATATLDEALFAGYDPEREETLRLVIDRLCGKLQIDSATIEYEISDEFYTDNDGGGALGTYQLYEGMNRITVSRKYLADPHVLLATLVHELGHVLLIGQGRIKGDEYDHEPLTDLVMVFLGFGPILANSTLADRNYSDWKVSEFYIERRGYLTMPMYGYAIAVLSQLRGEPEREWSARLRPDVRSAFHKTCIAFDTDPPPNFRTLKTTNAKPSSYGMRVEDSVEEGDDTVAVDSHSCVYCGEFVKAFMEIPVCRLCRESIDENQKELEDEAAERAILEAKDVYRARLCFLAIFIAFATLLFCGWLFSK